MTNELIKKLAQASKQLGAFSADKRNQQQNYDYISADQVLSRVGSALAEVGVMIVPSVTGQVVEMVNPKPNQTRYDAVVDFKMTITDGESKMVQKWSGRGSDYGVPDKALYKAITSGHKYFLMKLFNIGVGNEDGEHEVQPAQKKATNGTEPEPKDGPLPDDEQVIYESTIGDFFVNVLALIDRYDNVPHAKNALKELGYTGVKTDAMERVEQYRDLKKLAAQRDDEEAEDVPLFEDEAAAEMYNE